MKKIYMSILCLAGLLWSCDNDDDRISPTPREEGETPEENVDPQVQLENADFVLQLLHYADVDGNETTALNTVDEFSALVNGFKNDVEYGSQSLLVSSGDLIIPGPRFYGAENADVRALTGSNEPGHVDIAFANALGVVASAVGNHELDAGPGEFADAISSESRNGVTFSGATFPFLSANIDFSSDDDFTIGTDGADAATLGAQVAKYTITTINGERIGIIGATTPILSSITSTGSLAVSGMGSTAALASTIQPSVDALQNAGVNKIILLAHMQQIAIEKELATLLDGVDIIVAGGSNTRMGDDTDILFPGDNTFDETYPFLAEDASENPTLVVNVDGDFKYLGRLVVGFDANGVVDTTSLDPNLNGSYAATSGNVSTIGGSAIQAITALQETIINVISDQFENVLGYSSVYLDGRRSQVRTQETNLGNLTADANLWYANLLSNEPIQVSIKNGGGIRTAIGSSTLPPGAVNPEDAVFLAPNNNQVSEGDLRAVLRFDNGLVRLTVTAAELKDILEHAVAGTEIGATPGQFPQVAGVSFTFTTSGTSRTAKGNGTRISQLTVGADVVVMNGMLQGDPTRTFNIVTLNFLANGGDDYPFTDSDLSAPNRLNFYEGTGFGETMDYPDGTLANDPGRNSTFSYTGGEQDALAEYLLSEFSTPAEAYNIGETPISGDTRIRQ